MSTFYVVADDEVVDQVAVITMGGELDYAVSPQLRERMLAQIASGRRRLLLDLSTATFIDSTAIGVIVGAVSRLRASGGGAVAVVCGEHPPADTAAGELGTVRRIFEIAGVDAGVALCSTREEALSHLSAVV
jgi:anti-sigma B factor antagonist